MGDPGSSIVRRVDYSFICRCPNSIKLITRYILYTVTDKVVRCQAERFPLLIIKTKQPSAFGCKPNTVLIILDNSANLGLFWCIGKVRDPIPSFFYRLIPPFKRPNHKSPD